MGSGALMNADGWPDVEGIPAIAAWRIFGPELRQLVALRAIQEAAGILSNEKVVKRINEAAQKAAAQVKVGTAIQPHIQMGQLRADDSDDAVCGTGLSALLNWLKHHPPGQPPPKPWVEIATIGLMGDFAMNVGGVVRAELATVLRSALTEYTG